MVKSYQYLMLSSVVVIMRQENGLWTDVQIENTLRVLLRIMYVSQMSFERSYDSENIPVFTCL